MVVAQPKGKFLNMKRVFILSLCAALAGCATTQQQVASAPVTCTKDKGGIAAGAGHMVGSGNLMAGLVGLLVIGAVAAEHPECNHRS
jgi:hypothetical protein